MDVIDITLNDSSMHMFLFLKSFFFFYLVQIQNVITQSSSENNMREKICPYFCYIKSMEK